MKLILRSDLARVGKRGDIIEVADGYARNYLLPRQLAIRATDGAVEQAAKMRRSRDLRDASDKEASQSIASALVSKVIEISAKAGREGKLFGSVTAADVVEAISAQTGIDLDRKSLEIDTIKTLGSHTVTARLHADVSFPIRLDIVPVS